MNELVPNGATLDDAVRSLRLLILAGENYRQAVAQLSGLGITETQALSYLAIHGDRGQTELGADLGITSSASTALVDRLERQGVARRYAHPSDRRRLLVALTDDGRRIVQLSRNWLAAGLGGIEADELADLSRTLGRIAQDLRAESARLLAEQK